MQRVVIHVDMDSFFAAIEERENPKLRGKALVICMFSGRSELSGSVSTCNYAARAYGIKSGMPCSRAKKLMPDALFLPVRKAFYNKVSADIMIFLMEYADQASDLEKNLFEQAAFEQLSVDEAFLEVTERTGGDFSRAIRLGFQIKAELWAKEKLSCSIGIGPNKLIAKMASDVQKPNGLTAIRPRRFPPS